MFRKQYTYNYIHIYFDTTRQTANKTSLDCIDLKNHQDKVSS